MDCAAYQCTVCCMELLKKSTMETTLKHRKIRKISYTVRCTLKPMGAHLPLSTVVALDDQTGKRREHSQKMDLEQACLAEAGRRFTQANQTPLLSTPFLEIFGECSQTKAFQHILSGKFSIPPDCDRHMAQFLTYVQQPHLLNKIPECSAKAYCQGWQCAQESTGSSAFRALHSRKIQPQDSCGQCHPSQHPTLHRLYL